MVNISNSKLKRFVANSLARLEHIKHNKKNKKKMHKLMNTKINMAQ